MVASGGSDGGFAAMPVTGRLFWRFEDKGWIFSKVLAIAATGFLTWFLTAIRLIPLMPRLCCCNNPMRSYLFFPSSKGIKRKDRMFSS